MTRLRVLTFAATVMMAVPAAAEPAGQASINSIPSLSRMVGEPPAQVERRGFSFPVVEYRGPGGVWQQRRGIIAGKKVAPGTVLGIGIFQTTPKLRGHVGEVPHHIAPRKNRRAAVGLTMKF